MFGFFLLLHLIGAFAFIVFLLKHIKEKKSKDNTGKSKKLMFMALGIWFISFMFSVVTVPETDKTNSEKDSYSKSNGIESQEEKTNNETKNASKEETDIDIIMRTEHPTYYGSVEQSHIIWDDVEKGKIVFADSTATMGDNTILCMDAYRDSDLIRGILILFRNMDNSSEYTLDKVLPIVATYIPFDVLDSYYQYGYSKHIMPDEGEDENDYYVVTYHLTDKAKEDYYSNNNCQYAGSLDVIIDAKEGVVQSASITYGTPKWMNFSSLNGFHEGEWKCDFYEYR